MNKISKRRSSTRIWIWLMIIGLTEISVIKGTAQISMSGSLTGHIYSLINQMPGAGGNNYINPTPAQYGQWKKLIDTLLNKHYSAAASMANTLSYQLIEFNDTADLYYILEKQDTANNYWGSYVYNPSGCRDIVIQCPHPKYDYNTGKQGIYVMKKTRALFYCLAGTHRCNDSTYSSCSGTTTACNSSTQPYRISDMAHNDSSIFQATSEALKEFNNTLVFIQFHGFSKTSSDPYVIMSNGTRITPWPDYINQIKNELSLIDPILDFKIAHQNLSWTRLLAFTNVQGRYINGSTNACHTNADTTLGTFIHIEQEKTRLRMDSTKWDKMVQAFQNTFACPNTGIQQTATQQHWTLYPNPIRQQATLVFDNKPQHEYTLSLYDAQGRQIRTIKNIKSNKVKIERCKLPGGLYFFQLQSNKATQITGRFTII